MNFNKKLLVGPLVLLLALSAVMAPWAGAPGKKDDSVILNVEYGYEGAAKGGRYVPLDVSIANL